MNTRPPAAGSAETVGGMVVSLLFWLSLLAATTMFAAVGLSPKILERMRLEAQFDASQFRLVQMEQQNEQLERVLEAIRKDKDFAAEMTRIEFDAMRQDEEIIPVESGLRLSPRDLSTARTPAVIAQAWYRPILVPFAENDQLRRNLLTASAVLVVISFTWFQPARATQVEQQSGKRNSLWRQLRARYVRAN